MNRRPELILSAVQIVFAVALVVAVVILGGGLSDARSEVDALRGELADTRARLTRAEADRDRLQDRVDALTAALLAVGVDPQTIPAEPSSLTEPETAAPQAPAGRSDPPSRPAEPKPNRPPPPEQSAPPPPPPQDEPDPPGPLPPQTCELLPPLCS